MVCIVWSCLARGDDAAAPATQTATTRRARHYKSVALDLPDVGSPVTASKIGGCRTPGENLLVAALSPGDAGLTTSPSPTLYWYLSNPTPHPVEVTLTPVGKIDPILDLTFDGSHLQGIQKIDLASYGIQLEAVATGANESALIAGQVLMHRQPLYEWVVAVIRDPERRSRDVVGVGFIERVIPSQAVSNSLAQADDPADRAIVAASENLWYDALSDINEAIEGDSDSAQLREARAHLLAQVGLSLNLQGPGGPASNTPVALAAPSTGPSLPASDILSR
jgi:hypothetical protein